MQADGRLPRRLRRFDRGDHLLERHFGAVEDAAVGLAACEQGGVYEAPRIDDLIGPLQKRGAAQSDEIRRAGPRADEMYHKNSPQENKKTRPKGHAERQARERLCMRASGSGRSSAPPPCI